MINSFSDYETFELWRTEVFDTLESEQSIQFDAATENDSGYLVITKIPAEMAIFLTVVVDDSFRCGDVFEINSHFFDTGGVLSVNDR